MDTISGSTARSEKLAERLRAVLPGGDTRASTFYEPYPIAVARGEGCRIVDIDGNEYIDLWNNFTALAHGHAHPAIVTAISQQAEIGTAFPAPTELQAALAERIQQRLASVDLLRFTNSGSEAVMLAVRAARAFTGRELVVKAEGGYHGCWEQVPVTSAGRGRGSGVPQAVGELVRQCVYNDVESLRAVMEDVGERAAAVILEPVLCAGGVIVGEPRFFEAARKLCDDYGALLIFDEVVSFRLAWRGYQSTLAVEPDITTLGKVIGGGLPVGATGGKATIMELFDPRRPGFLHHSGTFNGNPLTAAAGCASLDLLDVAAIEKINALGAALAVRLESVLVAAGVLGAVTSCGSLVQLHLETGGQVSSFADTNFDSSLLRRLHRASLEEGLLFANRGLMCTSTVMEESTVDHVCAIFERALERVLSRDA